MRIKIPKYIIYLSTSFLLIISLIIYNERDYLSYLKIKYDLNKIDSDTLGKYFALFRFSNSYNQYDINQFLNYVKDKNKNLYNQLLKNNIKLISPYTAINSGSFTTFYHFGPDNIDNEDSLIIIWPRKDLSGDIIVNHSNYFNIDTYSNSVYVVEHDTITRLMDFNFSQVYKRHFKNCENEVNFNIPNKIDTINTLNSISFIDGRIETNLLDNYIETNSKMDEKSLTVIKNDSLFLDLAKKYKFFFITFKYLPVKLYECKSVGN